MVLTSGHYKKMFKTINRKICHLFVTLTECQNLPSIIRFNITIDLIPYLLLLFLSYLKSFTELPEQLIMST